MLWVLMLLSWETSASVKYDASPSNSMDYIVTTPGKDDNLRVSNIRVENLNACFGKMNTLTKRVDALEDQNRRLKQQLDAKDSTLRDMDNRLRNLENKSK